MAKRRFIRRYDDGSSTQLDIEEVIRPDEAGLLGFSPGWAIAGFLFGMLVGCMLFIGLHLGQTWPTGLRVALVGLMAAVGTYAAGKLGNILTALVGLGLLGLLLWAIGRLVWNFM